MNIRKAVILAVALVSLSFAVSCKQSKDEDTSGSVDLASLSVSPGELNPEFDKDTTEYTVTVPNSVTSITVTAKPEDKYAGVGKSPGNPVELEEGLTEILITVTADSLDLSDPDPDPSLIKRYYINVTRQAQ